MKRISIYTILVLGLQMVYAQNNLKLQDIGPNIRQHSSIKENFIQWDTLFYYLMPDANQYTTTGAETDGNHYYVGGWSTPDFLKYDMDGNFIEAFTIAGVLTNKDMAFDGQYFYSGASGTTLQVMDLENKNLIQGISMPFKIRALAYNDDLDVFYANDWSDDIKVFQSDGTIVDTIPYSSQTHTYKEVYGFAYDNWSAGGPYLWAFVQDGPSPATLVQLALPSGLETGFILDLSYLADTLWNYAGGLFTYPDTTNNKLIIGGIIQNYALFGLELDTSSLPPPIEDYAVSYQHASLVDSFDVMLSWSPVKHYLINEYFDDYSCPPFGWDEENNGGAGWNGMFPHYEFWPIPEIDSRYAVSYEDTWSSDRCCDYLISPEFELDSQHDYYLRFESYFDGSNNHSGYVKYSLDDGQTWELLHTIIPDSGQWVDIKLDLSPLPDNQPLKIAFHADDNGGVGSGWAINNVMLYTPDIPVTPLGYDIYRNDIKVNSALITDTVFVDYGVLSGDHEYHITTVYAEGEKASGKVNAFVPYYPAAPPGPDCNPPTNLQTNVIYPNESADILLEWEAPEFSISKDNAWNLQFVYPLAGEEEAGFTCDGSNFYTTFLKNHYYGKYDLQGNHIKDINVFEWSARNMEYVPQTGYAYVSYERYLSTEIINLPSGSWMGNFNSDGNDLGMAYNPDLDAFYINDGSVYIRLVDRESGDNISITPTGPHGNYYDLAYDNWSPGGPYLWGFSADGPNGCTLVQMSLPDCQETGFTYDASWLASTNDPKPGGLFIMEDLVPGTVSICGLIQGDLMFGLELGAADWNFELGGYNVYMDDNLHNQQLITDTSYLIYGPAPGTYNFEVNAVYVDSIGDLLCESPMEGPASVVIPTGTMLIGGNVLTGAYKLDAGNAKLYSFKGGIIQSEYKVDIDKLGYYFFPEMTPGDYMMHASPGPLSIYYNSYAPTYMDGNIHWEDVNPVNIGENSYNNDILLIEMAEYGEGYGKIGGIVYEQSTNNETPLEDVLILLFNNNGECIATDYTDTDGEYSFHSLALGNYGLMVEIAGKSMTQQTIYITESLPEQTNVNMMVLSDEIVFGINDELPEWIEFVSELYPNPSRGVTSININLSRPSGLRINVYDISGRLVQDHSIFLDNGDQTVNIEWNSINKGIYYISFEFELGYVLKKKLLLIR